MLQFEGKWRYDSPGPAEREVIWAFRELIDKICGQGWRKGILEHFKSHFASAAGTSYHSSSDEGWASTDLDSLMNEASENAPIFIEAFYNACEELERSNPEMEMPGVGRINRILTDTGAGFQIDPPKLIAMRTDVPVAIPEDARSVQNEAELLGWLRDRSRRDGVVLAVRAALRCLWAPICSGSDSEELSLVSFRVCLLGVIAANEKGRAGALSPSLSEACGESQSYDGEVLSLYRALIGVLVSMEGKSSNQLNAIAEVARVSAEIVSWPADYKDAWTELNSDVQSLDETTASAVVESRLFSENVSMNILDEVISSNDRYRGVGLAFLADWYESIINGDVQDLEMLGEIASLPEKDWAKGADHIAEMISAIKAGRRLREATPLAEEIVFDHSSGKLRVEPIPMLPRDLYETVLDKMRDSVADMRRVSERSNSYGALTSTLELLERTSSIYAGNPQRVHDDQLLASRKIQTLVDEGYVPEDHEVAGLMQVLDTNAVDIRAAIPEVAVAAKKRSEIRIREVDEASRDKIKLTVKVVSLHSDEALAEELREDERTTFGSEEGTGDIESPYRLASRLGRAAKIVQDLDKVAEFGEKYGPLISNVGQDVVKFLEKLVGL